MDLIIYYSRTNNTKEISELIAKEKNAELLEIKDKKSRSGPTGFILGALDSVRGKNTSISYDKKDLSSYENIYIGTPVWASKPTPSIIKFIEENDFNGTNVTTFATFMGSGGEATLKYMNDTLKNKGATIKSSFAFKMTGNDKKELVKDALKDE